MAMHRVMNGTLADAACGFHCGLFCVCLLRVRLLRLVTHRVRKDGLAGGGPHVLLWAILRLLVAWTTVATGHVQGEERWPGWGDPRVLSWDEWVA